MTASHPLPFNEIGCLPMGRHTVTEAEAKAYCITPDAAHRAELWEHLEKLTRMVRGAVGTVPAFWLGGSFLTDKERPNDIDVVYLLARKDVEGADVEGREMLNLLQKKRVQARLGLPIDAYMLDWWPRPGINRGTATDRPSRYLENRGYWDDLWSRRRDDTPALDKLPRRGYLEVIVDGFN